MKTIIIGLVVALLISVYRCFNLKEELVSLRPVRLKHYHTGLCGRCGLHKSNWKTHSSCYAKPSDTIPDLELERLAKVYVNKLREEGDNWNDAVIVELKGFVRSLERDHRISRYVP